MSRSFSDPQCPLTYAGVAGDQSGVREVIQIHRKKYQKPDRPSRRAVLSKASQQQSILCQRKPYATSYKRMCRWPFACRFLNLEVL